MHEFMPPELRDFIMMTEELNNVAEPPVLTTTQSPSSCTPRSVILEELNDIIFKLRAFTESSDGEFAIGVEYGMQRAADMIEHVLTRHNGEQGG